MTDFDDDDGDDYGDEFDDCCDRFMLASDETVYDKASEASNTVNVSKLADQYWKYPLQPENIKFVNLFKDLQSCIKIVFKVNFFHCLEKTPCTSLNVRYATWNFRDLGSNPQIGLSKMFSNKIACNVMLFRFRNRINSADFITWILSSLMMVITRYT